MKLVINRCYGGFGLSDKAYEKLIEWGIPVCKYTEDAPEQVIFDRELTPQGESSVNDIYWKFEGTVEQNRYWEVWLGDNRSHALLLRVVEELGEDSFGQCAKLEIVEIPDGTEWELDEYDGIEHIAEAHKIWP